MKRTGDKIPWRNSTKAWGDDSVGEEFVSKPEDLSWVYVCHPRAGGRGQMQVSPKALRTS